jgi:hypothetical protein
MSKPALRCFQEKSHVSFGFGHDSNEASFAKAQQALQEP